MAAKTNHHNLIFLEKKKEKNTWWGTHFDPNKLLMAEVFNVFKDERGNFNASLGDDVMGLLSLYETSFHLIEGESVLEEAREFTRKHLQEYIKHKKASQDDHIYVLVSHALELPLHWRMRRLEARWFIDVYEKRPHMNSVILELAKLDFNMVQSMHQEDLKYASM